MNGRELCPHIVKLDPNLKGNDYIIGDVHGSRDELAAVIADLTQYDRLFIVGDLVDKGLNSIGVVTELRNHIITRFTKGLAPQIFSVRGNHEVLCLKAIEEIENGLMVTDDALLFIGTIMAMVAATDSDKSISEQPLSDIRLSVPSLNAVELYLSNGGRWLVDLYLNELSNNAIETKDNLLNYTDNSEVKKIKDYFMALPYIYHVEEDLAAGIVGFNIVHADLPFDDEELDARVNSGNLFLSDSEIKYAIWARDALFYNGWAVPIIKDGCFGRRLTYVGHTIIGYDNLEEIIRSQENIVNLDVGLYARHTVLRVNHTRLRADALLPFRGSLIQNLTREYRAVTKKINQYLQSQLSMELMAALTIKTAAGLKIVRDLIAAGANPNALIYVHELQRSLEGLSVAVGVKNIAAIKILFELGAHPSGNNNLALINAVRTGRLDILELFLKAYRLNLDLAAYDDGVTALHEAAECNDLDMVIALLNAGAYPEPRDKLNNTPAMLTASPEIQMVIEHHVNLKRMLDMPEEAQALAEKSEKLLDDMVADLVKAKPVNMKAVSAFLASLRLKTTTVSRSDTDNNTDDTNKRVEEAPKNDHQLR